MAMDTPAESEDEEDGGGAAIARICASASLSSSSPNAIFATTRIAGGAIKNGAIDRVAAAAACRLLRLGGARHTPLSRNIAACRSSAPRVTTSRRFSSVLYWRNLNRACVTGAGAVPSHPRQRTGNCARYAPHPPDVVVRVNSGAGPGIVGRSWSPSHGSRAVGQGQAQGARLPALAAAALGVDPVPSAAAH
jgi:hypothetical protein